MNCRSVENHLSAYLDGELPGDLMLEVRSHLADCSPCTSEMEELRALKRLLGRMPVVRPSSDFEERLVSTVLREQPARRTIIRPSLPIFVGIAAGAMAMTLLSLTLERRSEMEHLARTQDAIAHEISRDLAFEAAADPMSGAPIILPASYGSR
jgi:anti-sigma factor RsiW